MKNLMKQTGYYSVLLCIGLLLADYTGVLSARNTEKNESQAKAAKDSTQAASHKKITTSLADALHALGVANGLDIEFRDERKNTVKLKIPGKIQFNPGTFWADLAKIDGLFYVSLEWIGAFDGWANKIALRVSDKTPKILAAYAEDRFRIISTTISMDGYITPDEPDKTIAIVSLNFLPGEKVLSAEWHTDINKMPYFSGGSPLCGDVRLAIIPIAQAFELSGSVDVLMATKSEQVMLSLSPGSVTVLPPESAVEKLCFQQLIGTDYVGTPGTGFELDKQGSRELKAFIVDFTVEGPASGEVTGYLSECYVIDSEGIKHPATEMGWDHKNKTSKKMYQAVFPVWKGNAKPVKMGITVPVQTRTISLKINQMQKLPYGLSSEAK